VRSMDRTFLQISHLQRITDIKMHLKRWLTAVFAAPPLTLFILKSSQPYFASFIAFIAMLCLFEYYSFSPARKLTIMKGSGFFVGILLMAGIYIGGISVVPEIILLLFFTLAATALIQFPKNKITPNALANQFMGLLYIPFLLSHLILIRAWDQGVVWIFFVLSVIFAGDTGAYYAGNLFGRRKLSPSISPGKTLEGSIGGLLVSLLVGIIFKKFWFTGLAWGMFIFVVILIEVMAQIGDLFESMLKRSAGVKDSGRLLPGHGGLLDRIDGLLFAAPTLYYLKMNLF